MEYAVGTVVLVLLVLSPIYFWKLFDRQRTENARQFSGTYLPGGFWSGGGRMHRLKYFFLTFLLSLITTPFTQIDETGGAVLGVIALIAIYLSFIFMSKRLHDIGVSGYYVWLALIPIVNFGIGFCLLFMPPQLSDNKFGPYIP